MKYRSYGFIQNIIESWYLMGTYQITHVRVSDDNATSTEKITDIRLDGFLPDCTVEYAVDLLDHRNVLFYTTSPSQEMRTYVEPMHPVGRNPYIRTKGNDTTKDNLLNLPRF